MSGVASAAYTQGGAAALACFLKHANAGRAGVMRGLYDRAKDKVVQFGKGQLDAAKGAFKGVSGGMGINMDPDISSRAHEILAKVPGSASMQWDTLDGMQRAAHRAEAIRHLKGLAPTLLTGAGAYGLHRALGFKRDVDRARAQREQEQAMHAAYMQQAQAEAMRAAYTQYAAQAQMPRDPYAR